MKRYAELLGVVIWSLISRPRVFFKQFILKRDLSNFSDADLIDAIGDLSGYIIEAGAWDGKDTFRLLKLFPNSKLICFEPMPEMFNQLSKKFITNNRITLINKALTSKSEKEMKFTYSSNLNPSGSLNKPLLHNKFPGKTNFDKEIEVKSCNINEILQDDLIQCVNLLWLDIQGSELEVIKSIKSENLKKIRYIHLEISRVQLYENQPKEKDVITYLMNKNFKMVAKRIPILSGNILFKNLHQG